MEYLALEIFDLPTPENPNPTSSKFADLPKDASITITDTSEIFGSGNAWSHPFTLNLYSNVHIFGSVGDMHGSRLHDEIDKRKARLWVAGLPLYLGYLVLDDEAEVDNEGNVDVSLESGRKTFDEMIESAKANQVPLMSDVRIGVALWQKRWVSFDIGLYASVELTAGGKGEASDVMINDGERWTTSISLETDGENSPCQEYPRMVFPKGEFLNLASNETESVNCLNTDLPYTEDENGTPSNPYCNVALCYQKQGYEKKKDNGDIVPDYSGEPEAQRGYEYMPANRVNSAPNFYVIYWIRALMKHLGIYVEENQMMDVEDLRRLFFVNTKCAYRMPNRVRGVGYDEGYGRYKFLEGERLVAETLTPQKLIKTTECGFTALEGFHVGEWTWDDYYPGNGLDLEIKNIKVGVESVGNFSDEYEDKNSYLHDAYATSECFPDADISEVISAIENGFGVRFLFSDNYQRVRIVLLRNILRSDEVQHIECEVISETKKENSIRGFRMTYGDTDDTHFYYKGFADALPHKKELWPDNSDEHDYSHWNLDADYGELIHQVSAFDKTCSVTPNTGNAFIIKVDKDAKRYDDLHPSRFEAAGFMDAEDGDCTGEDETIETVSVGFKPAIMNDLNMEEERKGNKEQRFALFVEETMRVRRPDLGDGIDYNDSDAYYSIAEMEKKYGPRGTVKAMTHGDGVVAPGEFSVTSDFYQMIAGLKFQAKVQFKFYNSGRTYTATAKADITHLKIEGHINEGYRLYLQDNYEPNDDGVSPIENHDWGLTLGIMRGSGSDAYVQYEADIDDEEGNDTWEIAPGSNVTAHPDTCDCYGNLWDYDGGTFIWHSGTAIEQMQAAWPNSNIDLIYSSGTTLRNEDTYIASAILQTVSDNKGLRTSLLFAAALHDGVTTLYTKGYAKKFNGMTREQMKAFDAGASGLGILIETDSSMERLRTLLDLQKRAFFYHDETSDPIVVDENGVGSLYGRFSLKLRSEKPNPYYDPDSDDPEKRKRYLEITNPNLRQRGLCDQFYKEYSYIMRNGRTSIEEVRMTLAQLLGIDKTIKAEVGDITGYVKQMQYTVSNETGLGPVTMEMLYI